MTPDLAHAIAGAQATCQANGFSSLPLAHAYSIARNLKYGPLHPESTPPLAPSEAARIIANELRTCGFNWLTGAAALLALAPLLATEPQNNDTHAT